MNIPHLDQWLGIWAMLPDHANALYAMAMNLDLHVHLASPQAAAAQSTGMGRPAEIRGRIAVVPLVGVLMKHVPSMVEGTSTVLARRQIRAAKENPEVSGIAIYIDSGGGTAAGTPELGDEIAAATATKPTIAFINDVGASSAYYAASQAEAIFANEAALTGCIGTYHVLHDASARAEKLGLKVHVVRAGKWKGMGTPGTAITAEQLAEFQRLVDSRNEFFLRAVATGRKLSRKAVEALANGKTFTAAEATAAKLIDQVMSWEQAFSFLVNYAAKSPEARAAAVTKGKGQTMDAIQEWDEAVAAKREQNPRMTKAEATRAVAIEQPELHQAFLDAYTEQHRAAVVRRR